MRARVSHAPVPRQLRQRVQVDVAREEAVRLGRIAHEQTLDLGRAEALGVGAQARSRAGGAGAGAERSRAKPRLHQAQLCARAFEAVQREHQLVLRVSRSHDRADAGPAARAPSGYAIPWANTPSSNSRSDKRIARAPSPTMTGVIGLWLDPMSRPRSPQPLLEETRVGPELFCHLGSCSSTSSARDAGGGHRRRMRSGEQERPGAVVKELDQRSRSRHVAAQGPERLRQRAHLHVHAAVQAEMVDGTAPVLAEDAAAVGIVHHHDAAMLLGDVGQLRQHTDVAIHAEDAVRDDQRPPRARQPFDDGARRGRHPGGGTP